MNAPTLITPADALDSVLAHVPAPRTVVRKVEDSLGFVLAEEARFDRDYPPFHRAMMDGFGVRAADAGRSVAVAGIVPAGVHWPGTIERGTAIEIMTGAPCPEGVESVVPVERVVRKNGLVELPASIAVGANIARQGSEGLQGGAMLGAGTVVTPLVAAALASIGREQAPVFARPRVAVITTGDELVRGDACPAPFQIRDSNGPLLRCLLTAIGVEAITSHHAVDNEDSLRAALSSAGDAEIIILTGGVSAGRRDLVPGCCSAAGFETVFHKVAQKPGKPLLFAVRSGQLLFGLPGNPLAVHLCTHRYVAAAIRATSGRSPRPETSTGLLAIEQSVQGDRTHFCFVTVAETPDGVTLTPLRQISSADVFSTPGAHALVQLDPGAAYPAGTRIPFEWLWGGNHP